MFSKALSASALLLASSSLVAAQTFSACNPVKGDSEQARYPWRTGP